MQYSISLENAFHVGNRATPGLESLPVMASAWSCLGWGYVVAGQEPRDVNRIRRFERGRPGISNKNGENGSLKDISMNGKSLTDCVNEGI